MSENIINISDKIKQMSNSNDPLKVSDLIEMLQPFSNLYVGEPNCLNCGAHINLHTDNRPSFIKRRNDVIKIWHEKDYYSFREYIEEMERKKSEPTVTGVSWEPQPSEDVATKGYIESLMPQEYKNHVKEIETKYSKLKLDMEVMTESHTMTIGHLLDILENLSKNTKILDVSKITYVIHKDGKIAVRFE